MEDSKPPRYMSDKAKGKQRAEPIDLAALAPQSKLSAPAQGFSPNIKFSIRFTDGAQDLRLDLPATKRVATLVNTIRERRSELSLRKLRLIHGGKNLARTLPLSTLRPNRRPVLETEFPETSQLPSPNKRDPKDPGALDEPVWIHCSIGDEIQKEGDDEEVTAEHSVIEPPRGFDRFSTLGLTEAEIGGYRRAFHHALFGTASAEGPSSSPYTEDESRTLEEQWISSFSSGSTFEPPPPYYPRDSAVRTTAQGLLIGFFAPVLSIFLGNEDLKPPIFFDGKVFPELGDSEVEALPSIVVPPAMSQAILTGLVLNFLGAVIFFLYT